MTPTLSVVLPWLICPTCQRRGCENPLARDGRSLRCPEHHCLDIAKQGYVTMTSTPAGANADTVEMIAARQRVLDGLASDVSKAAIRRAAKAHPRMAAVVADTWAGLPIRTGCIDAGLCVFAPRNRDEFARIMKPDGIFVVVTPLPDHLQQLRERTGMIGIQPHKHDELMAALASRFTVIGHEEVRADIPLDKQTASDAVAMGPSAHHIHNVHVDAMSITSAVEVTVLSPR